MRQEMGSWCAHEGSNPWDPADEYSHFKKLKLNSQKWLKTEKFRGSFLECPDN